MFNRYLYALDLGKHSQATTDNCHHCSSVQTIPKHLHPQSTGPSPDIIGTSFTADIVKRYRQLILVLLETVSSYTLTWFVDSEKHEDLRDNILILCSEVRPLVDGGMIIRVYPAPGLQALSKDPILAKHGVRLEI